mmetsp:Transcript_47269/g.88558  ORF Transcript_47269/g.88558 Transcript_47269/m.88558 type:complete len:86 (-) Transcript_47269:19-276(-)
MMTPKPQMTHCDALPFYHRNQSQLHTDERDFTSRAFFSTGFSSTYNALSSMRLAVVEASEIPDTNDVLELNLEIELFSKHASPKE